MKRRELLQSSAAFGLLASARVSVPRMLGADPGATVSPRLSPPSKGSIPVAFVVSEGAVVIDFCGPWEVFQDVNVPGRSDAAFDLYTVAETTAPIHTSGGMKVSPDHTFATAPSPKVVVIPAQSGNDAAVEWIRKSAGTADVVMSVCTGAFLLAKTGLLSGKAATTHHASYGGLAMAHPDIRVQRGARFVDEGSVATAGGLSSGIDLALHVVERYFGREVAQSTAYQMEYQGQGWTDPASNGAYSVVRASTEAHPVCPVCDMDVDPMAAPKGVYLGKTYYFCSSDHKSQFEASPETFLKAIAGH
jgi:transcriptional regulator GlxA family with amidase domain/YHS domain-containing protein